MGTHTDTLEAKLAEKIYYHSGSVKASCRQWNKMTSLRLQHEARIQGILGPNEPNRYSDWKLRLELACEARLVDKEEEERISLLEGEKVILVRKNGVLMWY